jgi:hypothetical protein
MKKTLLLLSTFLYGFVSSAQTDEDESKKFRLQLSAVTAFVEYDFGGLNEMLKSKGLPQAKDGLQFTYGFKITNNTDNILSEKKLFWDVLVGVNSSKNNANGHSLEQLVTFGEMSLGYHFFQKDRHNIYARLGYGGMMYNVDIHNNSDSGSFSGALDEYGGSVKIRSRNNQYISLGAGYDWAIDKEKDFLLGVHLGYRIGLGKEKWEIKGRSYDDSPESSANGFFIGLSVSFR